jgi:hypothetical protein
MWFWLSLSISPVKIPSRRFRKLGSIKADELLPVAEMMKEKGRVGYQEALLEVIAKSVADIVGSSAPMLNHNIGERW